MIVKGHENARILSQLRWNKNSNQALNLKFWALLAFYKYVLKKSSVLELPGGEPFDRLNVPNLKIPSHNKDYKQLEKQIQLLLQNQILIPIRKTNPTPLIKSNSNTITLE